MANKNDDIVIVVTRFAPLDYLPPRPLFRLTTENNKRFSIFASKSCRIERLDRGEKKQLRPAV